VVLGDNDMPLPVFCNGNVEAENDTANDGGDANDDDDVNVDGDGDGDDETVFDVVCYSPYTFLFVLPHSMLDAYAFATMSLTNTFFVSYFPCLISRYYGWTTVLLQKQILSIGLIMMC
jgi:hypothetical protein